MKRTFSVKKLFSPLFTSVSQISNPPLLQQEWGPRSSISFCLIVKNEAHCLEHCLESLASIATEIIVVDTGSTDGTVEIAQRYGQVLHHAWNDDFAEARNVALAHATSEWIGIVDADETLPTATAQLLSAYLSRPEFQNQPVVLNWRVCSDHHQDLFSRGLFPNGYGIRFVGRVHEIPVLPHGTLASYNCQELMLQHHTSPEQALSKEIYYQSLLKLDLAEEADPVLRVHAQKHLGLSHVALEEWPAAWEMLSECYVGMQSVGIAPQDGFYGEVLRGLVQVSLELGHSDTQKYAHELKQYYSAEPLAQKALLSSSKRNPWRTGMAAIAMSVMALAACQTSNTFKTTAIPPHIQEPIILSEGGIQPLKDTFENQNNLNTNPHIGDFRIKAAYFCPEHNSTVTACYASGGTPVIGAGGLDPSGNFCYHFDHCEGGIVPTPTPPAGGGGGGGSGGGGGGGGIPQTITIDQADFNKTGEIVIKGHLDPKPPKNFNYSTISQYYNGDLDPLQTDAKGNNAGSFTLKVPSYNFTSAYQSKIPADNLYLPKLKVALNACTPRGCADSNTAELDPGPNNAEVEAKPLGPNNPNNPNFTTLALSDGPSENTFSVKQATVPNASGYNIFAATGNNALEFKGSGHLTAPTLNAIKGMPEVRVKVSKDGTDYFTSQPESITPDKNFSFKETWDGRHNGQLVAEGNYVLKLVVSTQAGPRTLASEPIYIVRKKAGSVHVFAFQYVVVSPNLPPLPVIPVKDVSVAVFNQQTLDSRRADTNFAGYAKIPLSGSGLHTIGIDYNGDTQIFSNVDIKNGLFVTVTILNGKIYWVRLL